MKLTHTQKNTKPRTAVFLCAAQKISYKVVLLCFSSFTFTFLAEQKGKEEVKAYNRNERRHFYVKMCP